MPRQDVDRPPTLSPPMFVGRERELAALGRALAHPPAVVLVEGEAGIGKTRLVREFLDSAELRGVLVGSCPPLRRPQTLGPVVDALRQSIGGVGGLGLSGLAGALRPLFPEWADELPPAPAEAADATAARHRVFGALAELLHALGVRVLVVEDVHWADEASLEFLLYLSSRQAKRLSLLVTYRPEDVPADSLVRRLARATAGERGLRLMLGPLDVPATAQMVSSMLDDESVSEAFAAFVHERTEGLPIAVEESVRLMADRNDLVRRDGRWVRWHLSEITVPPSVRDAVLERMARLSVDAQAVLSAAAVLTNPTDEATLTAVADLDPELVRAGLTAALACGLLTEVQPALFGFRHVLATVAVYEAVPAPERRVLHHRAGCALELVTPHPLTHLARHFAEAGETAKWCHYGEQAADQALATGDEATALALLCDLVTHDGLPPRDVTRLANKVPLLLVGPERGRSLVVALRSVLDSGLAQPREEVDLRCELGRLLVSLGDRKAGRAELERAVPYLGHDPAAAARAMTLLGHPTGSGWPAKRHRDWLRRAAELDTAPMPAAERLLMQVNRTTALLILGEEEGWAEAARIPTEGSTAREWVQVTRGLLNTGEAAMMWGHYARARGWLARAVELAQAHEYPQLQDHVRATEAHLDWFTGAWPGLPDRTAALIGSGDIHPLARREAALAAGLHEAVTGTRARAEEYLTMALDAAREQGAFEYFAEPVAALARLMLADGRPADALSITDGPTESVVQREVWLWATELAPVRVAALLAVGRTGEAADLVARFTGGMRGRDAPAPKAGLALCRALLTEASGDHQRAATSYARAAAAWDGLPRPYDALLAREKQGTCLLAAGQRSSAVTTLTTVVDGLANLGATRDADRVARTLRQHGVRKNRPGAGRPSYGDQLSPREREVVRLLVTGQDYREIAQTLVLSPKTVVRHIDSAMHKLKAESRVALAVKAVQAGVVPKEPPAVSDV